MTTRIAFLGVLFLLAAACTSDEVAVTESPQSAAETFLALIDQGKYEESWAEASALLKDNVDAAQWAAHAGGYRQALGSLDHRLLDSIEFQDSLEDMPAGEYAFVVFDSTLADGSSAAEMVGLVLDDDAVWRVIGYHTL